MDTSKQDEEGKAIVHTDLNRQVVKSDNSVIRVRFRQGASYRVVYWCSCCSCSLCYDVLQVPDIEFEIPCSKRGEINTVEGIMRTAAETLEMGQESRAVRVSALCDCIQP